jgi:hypothetical protein
MRQAKPKAQEEHLVPLGQAGIKENQIEAQVETLCRSTAFENQKRCKTLLRYLWPLSLDGKEPSPREIALEGLGMQNFDPGSANVRNIANKLRDCLKEHYASAETNPREVRLVLPHQRYLLHVPKSQARELQPRLPSVSRVVSAILEPAENADVYQQVTVRGRIDALHPDLRVWLVVETPSGMYYPQCRVSRASPEWQYEIRVGYFERGSNDGIEFLIHLVAADYDGDFRLYECVKAGRDGYGSALPRDCSVLNSRAVTRRDIR